MNFASMLTKIADEQDQRDGVDDRCQGTTVEEAARFVDLSVAYSPVIDDAVRVDQGVMPLNRWGKIPIPVKVERGDDGRYCLVWPKEHKWRYVAEEELRKMRARYLLVRGQLAISWNCLSPHEKRWVAADYFDGSSTFPEIHNKVFEQLSNPVQTPLKP